MRTAHDTHELLAVPPHIHHPGRNRGLDRGLRDAVERQVIEFHGFDVIQELDVTGIRDSCDAAIAARERNGSDALEVMPGNIGRCRGLCRRDVGVCRVHGRNEFRPGPEGIRFEECCVFIQLHLIDVFLGQGRCQRELELVPTLALVFRLDCHDIHGGLRVVRERDGCLCRVAVHQAICKDFLRIPKTTHPQSLVERAPVAVLQLAELVEDVRLTVELDETILRGFPPMGFYGDHNGSPVARGDGSQCRRLEVHV